ncbi:MAG: carbamoyl-phosphate synthase large subunit, partial [Lentisphaeria bacterium]|nr:carbamoyl-phosphate synthase large subunit [Lentisphaeria bacterium]
IEPLTTDILLEIIRRERPDALLPTLGGQTALNLAMDLDAKGILKRYNVEMIGANASVIEKAEDRQLFKIAMDACNLEVCKSVSCHTMEEAIAAIDVVDFPAVIRPGFTMGGSGGGIAFDLEEFKEIVARGLDYSPTNEVLVEESILGWKEFELEIMRDKKDNVVIICSIENVDPVGVHTGDSITVAPAQTLTDREYQQMRDAGIAVMREIGVETGGSNVQFAQNPKDGRLIVIEMNPRVSRSSALASKATGFPIAKFAAKLAVGYTLDELQNDITRETPAAFEPTIDYVVTKIPRFAFEKFATADDTLGTQMKSVGETMSIGKTFKQSFQKALRSLEVGRSGFGADGKNDAFKDMTDEELSAEIYRPNDKRIYYVCEALSRGFTVDQIYDICKIDKWFLRHMDELVAYQEEIKSAGSLEGLKNDLPLFRQTKEMGFSDKQIAYLLKASEKDVRLARYDLDLRPVYNLVDTCAAEFVAYTPYYYSTYADVNEVKKSDKKKIMILGGGPNRIGQGIEFDYCYVHASFALRDAGYETIMVNSNPETVSTDYDTSDRLYFEPLTLEDVLHIYEQEECDGVIVQFGGQTPLNLADDLKANGVNVIGTSPESIDRAEDRKEFQEMAQKIGIRQPINGIATNEDEAVKIADRIGYPVLVRPSFVLGGRAMVIVYKEKYLRKYMQEAVSVSQDKPILVDHYLENAVEVDVDCICDGEISVIGAIMEHVELAGIHSGDSSCIIPSQTLGDDVLAVIREHTHALAKELKVIGLMNIQFAIKDDDVYILEVNPRASRTVPFVSKAIGVPLAKLASLVMVGQKLKDLDYTKEIIPEHISVKEAVFPFARFPGTDIILSPEMKSTGEVMGIDSNVGLSYLKSQLAASNKLPQSGNIFVSVRELDKEQIVPLVADLVELGFSIFATRGTSTILRDSGIDSQAIFKISEGRPNALDLIEEDQISWIVNTPSDGAMPKVDEIKMRSSAVIHNIPITTTISGLSAAVIGLQALKEIDHIDVRTVQEYHKAIR